MPQRYYWAAGTAAERYSAWLARLEALGKRAAADPRLTTTLFHVLEKAPFAVGYDVDANIVYGPLLRLLEQIDDERVLPLTTKLIALPTSARQSVRRYLKTALPPFKETLERSQSIRRPLTLASKAAIEHLLAELGGRPNATTTTTTSAIQDAGTLYDLVLEDPDDDGARAVLADFLLEQNDPRGELITLQLKEERGEATDEDTKRIRSLLRANEKTWVGDLALVTKSRVFRRGFLDEVELQQNAAADESVWKSTPLSPLLATVRVLKKGKANEQHYRAFLFSQAMKSLAACTLQRKALLEDVVKRTEPWPSLREIILTFAPDKSIIEDLLRRRESTLPRLTKLTWGVKPGRVNKLIDFTAKLPNIEQLACVAVTPVSWYVETTELSEWVRAVKKNGKLAHLPALEIVFFFGLREDRLIATAGPSADSLVLDWCGDSLYFVAPILQVLAPNEVHKLRLRAHHDLHVDPNHLPILERFGKNVLDLDETWSVALA